MARASTAQPTGAAALVYQVQAQVEKRLVATGN